MAEPTSDIDRAAEIIEEALETIQRGPPGFPPDVIKEALKRVTEKRLGIRISPK